jgi:hypothetical protein
LEEVRQISETKVQGIYRKNGVVWEVESERSIDGRRVRYLRDEGSQLEYCRTEYRFSKMEEILKRNLREGGVVFARRRVDTKGDVKEECRVFNGGMNKLIYFGDGAKALNALANSI